MPDCSSDIIHVRRDYECLGRPSFPHDCDRYRFRANLYGTSWYHSHFSAQYTGGLLGPLIVYGPNHVPFDIDLGPLLLSDCAFPEYILEP